METKETYAADGPPIPPGDLKDAKIERLEEKIKRQADVITRLERSRRDMRRVIRKHSIADCEAEIMAEPERPNPSNSTRLELSGIAGELKFATEQFAKSYVMSEREKSQLLNNLRQIRDDADANLVDLKILRLQMIEVSNWLDDIADLLLAHKIQAMERYARGIKVEAAELRRIVGAG